jgi:RNA polymerase sigma factor (sigma-70 family)
MFRYLFVNLNRRIMMERDFKSLLLTNIDFLKPFAFTLTRDSEVAKDLYQETMFRALSNSEKYNVGTNIRAWLYTIMRNIFINNYRKKSKQHTVLDYTVNEALINSNQEAASNEAISSLMLKDIYASFQKLPELFRKPFLLYYEGYKYNEIAEALSEPLGTIKSRIHFARKLLKADLVRN